MARYNFTNFLVRNFKIETDEDNGLRRMLISGFLSYDEAMQYARQLYADEAMKERLKGCRSLIVSDVNLPLLGTRFSYDDYLLFYEKTFVPMKVSQEKLLIQPESIEQPDIEDQTDDAPAEDEQNGDTPQNPQQPKKTTKKKVEDFDFGDDFW
jgi:hypothetical protein